VKSEDSEDRGSITILFYQNSPYREVRNTYTTYTTFTICEGKDMLKTEPRLLRVFLEEYWNNYGHIK